MRYYLHESRKAIWSQRIALICLVVFVTNFVLHRFWGLPTPVAMKVFGACVAAAVAGLVLGVSAYVSIWREGFIGAGRATVGTLVSLLILAVPLWSLPSLLTLPRLNDVTTDISSPPRFEQIASIRTGQANAPEYEPTLANLQTSAYPDIRPAVIPRPAEEVHSAVREVVKELDWHIVSEAPPEDGRPGVIEAVDRSILFGFADDVAIRVRPQENATRVDVRSASRYGVHDLGRNASRIRNFFAEVNARLDKIAQAERMERVMAEKEKLARKNKRSDQDQERRKRPRRVTSQPERTYSRPSAETRDTGRAPSQSSTRSERRQLRRQRQRERTRAARRFWEQLAQ